MSDEVAAASAYASGTVGAANSLVGGLRLPADKSVAHRALLLNAMAEGEAEVTVSRPGEDVLSMARVLQTLGAVESIGEGPVGYTRVRLRGGGTRQAAVLPGAGGEMLDCGNAGTAMRLLIGALSGRPARATLIGDASLSGRPMERVAAPLRSVGAHVVTEDGHAPILVEGSRQLSATEHELPVASAQVIGALTIAGLAAKGLTVITAPSAWSTCAIESTSSPGRATATSHSPSAMALKSNARCATDLSAGRRKPPTSEEAARTVPEL